MLLLLPNLPQLVIGFYGTLMAGGVAVFTLPTTSAAELARQVRETGTKILVTYDQAADLAGKIKADSGLEHIILSGISDYLPFYQRWLLRLRRPAAAPTNGGGRLRFRALIRAARRPTANPTINANDLAVIQFTGGTTAEPKGVMLSHYNLVANTLQVRHWMPAAEEGKERFLSALPFTHSYGLTTALNVPISLGATLILKAQFQAADVLHSIQRHRPTIFPGVPAMYVAINNTPNVRKYGIRSIKACISGSAPLPVEVQEAFERLTRGRLVEGYGLTEASPVTHANPLNGLRKVGSIGIPLPSTEARLVDLSNGRRPVAAGQIGELAVRGPQVMQGYWNNPEATRQVLLPDGWLLTGDVAQMDSEGYYRIIARKVDMWYPARPGEPAFPRDVEEVLFEIPQVKEAAVVAIAGQPVAFIISGSERPATHSVIGYCKRRLPPELVPKLVIFLDDFPRTFIGKVLRRELARRYAHHKAEADPDEAPVSNLDD